MLSFNSFRKSQAARIGVMIGFALLLMVAAAMKEPRRGQAASRQRQSLSFEDRVTAQRAIEEVYWRHRIWPKENPLPKPPLDEVMPEEALRAKAEDYLRMSRALEVYWQRPVTGEQLQAEMERMARQTKQPEVLRELWAALGNDSFIIAECLARPLLVERLIRSLYASDERFHGELKRRAEAELSQPNAAAQMRQMSGEYRETKWIKAERAVGGRNRIEQPGAFLVDAEQWQEQVNKLAARVRSTGFSRVLPSSENPPEGGTPNAPTAEDQLPLGQLSGLQEDEEKFYIVMVMEQHTERIKVVSVQWKKVSFDEWWSGARAEVESELVGPRFGYRLLEIQAAPARYEGGTEALTDAGAPSARVRHTAVWTGSEMIVWGGFDNAYNSLNTGGRYDPATDSWTATSTTGAPSRRDSHTAVWIGNEMIIWGGYDISSSSLFNTGGRYNPATDTWTATSTTGASARYLHTAVWTGSEMIVWGGYSSGFSNTGGRYNPTTNTWMATNTTGAPSARDKHTAVWTGSEMIVWGGRYSDGNSEIRFNTGGRYNPATNTWMATNTTGAPSARELHTAIWTGGEMIVWGGFGNSNWLNTGGQYNPVTNAWTATNTTDAPSGRTYHTAVRASSEMIVWGGVGRSFPNTGGRYNPATDTWTATSTTGAPSARYWHTAVWTGSEMIVWGGLSSSNYTNTGGRYNLATDSWTATNASNPVPIITSLNPNSAAVGGNTFTIIVTGTNFITGSVVLWNGSNRVTAFVNDTTLRATITAADIATAGTTSVTVFNPEPSGGTSNALSFITTCVYSIAPTSQVFEVNGGTGNITVATGSGCSWAASSNASWITITSGSSGTGNGTVNYSVAANTDADTRTGTITIAGQTFTVTQDGTIKPVPTLASLSPNSAAAGGAGWVRLF